MKMLKHVGVLKNTGAKVLVVFRTLPGESNLALVLPTTSLPDMYHDALIQLVESDQAQDANEFGEIMFIRKFPDGRSMLAAMQQDGRLHKTPTANVIMTPTLNSQIPLDQLNVMIAEQKNIGVDDLAYLVKGGEKPKPEQKSETKPIEPLEISETAVLSDKDLAKNFRSQADALYKEAAKLRKQADELDPPVKKSSNKIESSAEAVVPTT